MKILEQQQKTCSFNWSVLHCTAQFNTNPSINKRLFKSLAFILASSTAYKIHLTSPHLIHALVPIKNCPAAHRWLHLALTELSDPGSGSQSWMLKIHPMPLSPLVHWDTILTFALRKKFRAFISTPLDRFSHRFLRLQIFLRIFTIQLELLYEHIS